MSRSTTRRRFLQSALASGALLELGDLGFMSRLRPLTAAEVNLDPGSVQFHPDIEPLVRFIEETPRERLLEEVAARIDTGLSYRQLLAALQLAGVRNIQPRPAVGFKFHSVLVVNSAHLASLASADEDRWLPIFWALDYFKQTQAEDVREGDWTMAPVDESRVPPAHQAHDAFVAAMDAWDVDAADAAVAGLARTAGAAEIYELFYRYGSRDFRSIGHKAIFVANSYRTLQCIGWHHAEPVLRSLAYALLMHEGDNPAERDDPADRPGRVNEALAAEIRPEWTSGEADAAATADLLAVLREADPEGAAREVVGSLNAGVSPQSVWDALFDGAGELLMRDPGIVPLHAVTSTNALHYAFQASGDDLTRRKLLLQNAAFLTLFRGEMQRRNQSVPPGRVDQLEPIATSSEGDDALVEIFHDVSQDRTAAAGKVLGYLGAGNSPEALIAAARRLIFLKGTNSHDYKFSSAVLEDYYHVSPAWRDRFLATSVFNLRGAGDRDNALVERTRAALGVS